MGAAKGKRGIAVYMLTVKTWFLLVGVGLCCLGSICFPMGYGANPKRDTSLFSNFADAGTFIHTGIVLFGVGALVVALTLLIPTIVHVVRRVSSPPPKKKLL